MADKLICIGICVGAFGVKGEVKIKSFCQTPEDIFSYGDLLDEQGNILLSPKSHRLVKNAFAVYCQQIKTREEAQNLAGKNLYIKRESLPAPDQDEFYFEDLIGCEVKTVNGKRVGKVIAVHEFGAGNMLEIEDKNGVNFFHPFTKTAVPKVDIKSGRIIIKPEQD